MIGGEKLFAFATGWAAVDTYVTRYDTACKKASMLG
jgi:hypothetical protein